MEKYGKNKVFSRYGVILYTLNVILKMKSWLRRLKIKWQIWRGNAIDIWSKNGYPANVLSNLCNNRFYFDGIECGSMEGFLQSLKYKDIEKQRQVCGMNGRDAKKVTHTDWQIDQIVWWRGKTIDRQGDEFLALVRNAYLAMFKQNESFRTALMSTKGKALYHYRGEKNPFKTILTENELCTILMEIRDAYNCVQQR